MSDALPPDDLVLTVEHCGQPLIWCGSRVYWRGIEGHSERRLICDTCGLRVTVAAVECSPLPDGGR